MRGGRGTFESWDEVFESAVAPADAQALEWESLFDGEDLDGGASGSRWGEDNGLARELATLLRGSRGKAAVFDRLRALQGPDPALRGTADAVALRFIASNMRGDDQWLADTIARHGPETHWSSTLHDRRHQLATTNRWPAEPGHIEGILLPPGVAPSATIPAHAVRAIYFPGSTAERALVLGGVHGSETAAADTVADLVAQLRGHRPGLTTIVVPELFADNLRQGRALETRTGRGSRSNTHRTTAGQADPNRQFPQLGAAFSAAAPVDIFGATIEPENQVLMELIQRYVPSRVASVHEIHSSPNAGIYADSRTDATSLTATKSITRGRRSVTTRMGGMLQYEETLRDWALAICMAEAAQGSGATVSGNRLGERSGGREIENARYLHRDISQPVRGRRPDKPSGRDGVSGGDWGSQAVVGGRDSITWITVEIQQRWTVTTSLGGRTRPAAQLRRGRMPYPLHATWDANRIRELAAFRDAIKNVFLENPTCVTTKRAHWVTTGRFPR